MLLLRALAVALAFAGIRGVGVILVDREGRFLVNHRARGVKDQDEFRHPARPYLAGRWAILAGYIERGEEPEETARRELGEEIGHVPERLHLVVSATWPRPVCLYAAGLRLPLEELRLGEGIEHRLVTAKEAAVLSPRIPLLAPVLRAFAGTPAYEACLRDARKTQ
jgi:8-oxo-dGTP pyrophosphatase MutT (NUDIX family)